MSSNAKAFNGDMHNATGDEVTQRPAGSRWFRRSLHPSAKVRLFCFPYAGGSARIFREWHDWCGPEVEVVALELPGRGFHSRSPSIDSMGSMIEQLLPVLDPLLDRPFALFGHSMGALISFELSRALTATGRKTPLRLFASGMRAPHLWGGHQIHCLPDDQFVAALRNLNGTPSEVLGDNSLLEMFIPLLRTDLCLSETYQFTPGTPLQHPITVFGGIGDVTTPSECLHEWQRHTRSGCTVRLFEGDHFFIHQNAHLMAASILKSLGRISTPAAFEPTFDSASAKAMIQEREPAFSGGD
ncbi:MAG TPA: alpha/beta fold hydrolase [Candidatus Angelobacter sp.]|nr:alpha/beta fold hydrolase [Candidatus Angelobacter sp.]